VGTGVGLTGVGVGMTTGGVGLTGVGMGVGLTGTTGVTEPNPFPETKLFKLA
jgi:hypothetical protein